MNQERISEGARIVEEAMYQAVGILNRKARNGYGPDNIIAVTQMVLDEAIALQPAAGSKVVKNPPVLAQVEE